MKKTLILTAAISLSFSSWAATHTSEFGALPTLKVNAVKAELGKRLFYDPRLSGDGALSCASCHQPDSGFSHPDALAPAYPGSKGFRNVPTLINTAYKQIWFHDGRIGTNLNDVTREMLTEDWLMNMDMRLMQERVKQDPVYVSMFKAAGYGEPSNGSIRKAIPEFLKTLTSNTTPFDQGEMSELALKGQAVFTGKAGCVRCHNGPLLSDGKPHNTGVEENLDIFRDPLRHHTFIAFNMFMGNENYMNLKRDVGAHVQTHKADGSDMGKFMTPTLRELQQTAPYMHNGMMETLQDVVAFYNTGGGEDSNKDSRLKPLNLTWQEQKALVAFLKSLSSEPLTTEKHVWTQSDYNYAPIADWQNAKN
ncbi:cytochrome-c peroxidase [Moritella yayanosii]|uniref:Putative SCO1/SenC family protein/methylamine utilization protein MauG n=1 Tax=Moritella yayanosii TaxID=69539 RepID=A0A330LN49_9GAMM|nr:cytochrome c peroxidase [Moritella yayanosii]SQD77646.1 putative SCO1/SenC family protein/methylamine utilization protein MauG [Moritella yayanosii]